jgi:hypothetical protein
MSSIVKEHPVKQNLYSNKIAGLFRTGAENQNAQQDASYEGPLRFLALVLGLKSSTCRKKEIGTQTVHNPQSASEAPP